MAEKATTPPSGMVPSPILADFDSGWVDGGHTADEYCDAKKAVYEKQYPKYNIVVHKLPDENVKNLIGHVSYRFQCAFVAEPK